MADTLRTVALPPGTRVEVGDVVRCGDKPLDLGRATAIREDGRGPLVCVKVGDRWPPKLMRLMETVVVAVEGLPAEAARRELDMASARHVARRLNRRNGYSS